MCLLAGEIGVALGTGLTLQKSKEYWPLVGGERRLLAVMGANLWRWYQHRVVE